MSQITISQQILFLTYIETTVLPCREIKFKF